MTISFGAFAHTTKGLPNVAKGSEVQIAGIGVHKGAIAYSVVLFDSMGNFVDVIGPYPAHAFAWGRDAQDSELQAMLKFVASSQRGAK